jgi:hypothetical protein
MSQVERMRRIVDLVTAPGSRVNPSAINDGYVVVVDGRTGKDACERTADAAFDVLLEEADEVGVTERSGAEKGAGAKPPAPFPEVGSPAAAIFGPPPTQEEINANIARNEERARRKGL